MQWIVTYFAWYSAIGAKGIGTLGLPSAIKNHKPTRVMYVVVQNVLY